MSGMVFARLRAIVELARTMTPAYTATSGFTRSCQRSSASREKLTCTNRKSASRFQSGQASEAGQPHRDEPSGPGESQRALECPGLGQHCPNRELARATAYSRFVTTDQEELVHSVSLSRQQVPLESQQVAISCIQAGDRAATHLPLLHARRRHSKPWPGRCGCLGLETSRAIELRTPIWCLTCLRSGLSSGLDLADELKACRRHRLNTTEA